MKNILYIGPYYEDNGYGRSSRRFISGLIENNNINLSIRPVYFTSRIYSVGNDLYSDLEQNSSGHYDNIIQHGYPDMFQFDSRFGENIGITQIETRRLSHSKYIENINLLDKVIVGSLFSAESLVDSGVKTEIKIIPEPYDVSLFDNINNDFFENKDPNTFIFYTIGQYVDKKNIKGIILAFLLEFDIQDNVELFIKTDSYYIESNILEEMITSEIEQIKRVVRRNHNNCPKISIITGNLKDKDILRLHKSCDCYIDAARADGNACCAIEAMLANKPIISTNGIGSSSFIDETNGYIIDSSDSNVFSTDFHNDLSFTIYELWYEPSIVSMREKMRQAFVDRLSISNDGELFDNKLLVERIYE